MRNRFLGVLILTTGVLFLGLNTEVFAQSKQARTPKASGETKVPKQAKVPKAPKTPEIPEVKVTANERSGYFYLGAGPEGTFNQKTSVKPGQVNVDTTWQYDNGLKGSRSTQRNWIDGIFSSSNTTKSALGPSLSTTRFVTKNAEGGVNVESNYTTKSGKTLSTNTTYQAAKGEGIEMTGAYDFGNGEKTGEYQAKAIVIDGTLYKGQMVTPSDGKEFLHNSQTTFRNGTITRTDNSAVSGGMSRQSVTTATISKTDNGLSVTGTYSGAKGAKGTFNSTRKINEDDNLIVDQTFTNSKGDTLTRYSQIFACKGEFYQDTKIKTSTGYENDEISRGFEVTDTK